MAEANPTNLSDEDPTKICDPCTFRGINTQAVSYCQVCSEYLCDTCEAVHRSSKALRDHELKLIEESQRLSIKQKALISTIMACEIHRTESLTLFCVNHDIAVCNVCNSMKHRKCNTQTLKQMSKDANKREDVSQCPGKIKTLLSEITEIKDSREKDKYLIEDCSRKCIQEVKKIKHQIIAFAERLANDMEDDIVNTQNQLIAEIENDIKAGVEMTKQMQQIMNSFETLGDANEDAIGDEAFVLMMKEKGNIKDGMEMKDDILKQAKQVTLEFQQSEKLVTLMSEITSMGRLQLKEKQISKRETVDGRESQLCFQDISSTTDRKTINAGTTDITGCTFMPDGELVICDRSNQSVKVFNRDFKLKNELKFVSRVWDVAVVSKNEIIVTDPDPTCLQYLNVSKNIVTGKRIPVGLNCWGVDCKNEKLYVSCHLGDGKGGVVKVLTMDGDTVNTFNISQANPYYLAVNSSGDRILISSYTRGDYGVLCIDNTGKTLFTYSDSQLNGNRGLLFDAYDNFMVCGQNTNNIHVVKSDGTKHRISLSQDDGLNSPFCLTYRPSDKTLVIGQRHTSDSLLAFTLK